MTLKLTYIPWLTITPQPNIPIIHEGLKSIVKIIIDARYVQLFILGLNGNLVLWPPTTPKTKWSQRDYRLV